MIPSALRLASAATMLSLSGCIGGLLGGGKPDQLYRFGVSDVVRPVDVTGAPPRTLLVQPPTFPPEVSADRIMTSHGHEIAYVKDARWVTSTPALYEKALEASMRSRAAIDFLDRSQAPAADGELRIVIDRFEAVYGTDSTVAPTVQVEGRASLSTPGVTAQLTHRIYGEQRATANTVSAIAAAFDAASAQSTSDLTDWVSATLPRRAKEVSEPR